MAWGREREDVLGVEDGVAEVDRSGPVRLECGQY